jgi:hypothetical protein
MEKYNVAVIVRDNAYPHEMLRVRIGTQGTKKGFEVDAKQDHETFRSWDDAEAYCEGLEFAWKKMKKDSKRTPCIVVTNETFKKYLVVTGDLDLETHRLKDTENLKSVSFDWLSEAEAYCKGIIKGIETKLDG